MSRVKRGKILVFENARGKKEEHEIIDSIF